MLRRFEVKVIRNLQFKGSTKAVLRCSCVCVKSSATNLHAVLVTLHGRQVETGVVVAVAALQQLLVAVLQQEL